MLNHDFLPPDQAKDHKKKPRRLLQLISRIFPLDLVGESERLEGVAQVAHDNSMVLWIGCGSEVAEGSRFGKRAVGFRLVHIALSSGRLSG